MNILRIPPSCTLESAANGAINEIFHRVDEDQDEVRSSAVAYC